MATTVAPTAALPRASADGTGAFGALSTLARRRAALTARTPRQIIVPLLGPCLLALIAVPALAAATGGLRSHLDYQAFADVGAAGLLIPSSCLLGAMSVLTDRTSGAQRELLAAPIPRYLLVLANLLVALALAALQLVVLLGVGALRGADFHITWTGVAWFLAGGALFTVFMYAAVEALASRVTSAEELTGAFPVVALLPYFFAGGLFPIGALPGFLTQVAKILPLTHALALLRYAFVDPRGTGLHDIWGMHNPTTEAWLSLAVLVLFALTMTAIAVRAFTRAAVK